MRPALLEVMPSRSGVNNFPRTLMATVWTTAVYVRRTAAAVSRADQLSWMVLVRMHVREPPGLRATTGIGARSASGEAQPGGVAGGIEAA